MAQTATTGNLANAQRIIIGSVIYTEEHNAPCMALTTRMTLPKGAKSKTVPKVGQMTIHDLVDGQDIVDEEEIGMSSHDLTAAETGAKVILTDMLVDQSDPDVFGIIGRQLGDANARKKNRDVIALYSGLNGGTAYGSAGKSFSVANFAATIANAKGRTPPFHPTYAVHHPHATYNFMKETTAIGASTEHWPEQFQMEALRNFWTKRSFNGVMLFESGDIDVDSSDDAIGVLAQKDALVTLQAKATKVERDRDISLRAVEVVMTSRYGVFELDDDKGAPLTYDAAAPSTAA